MAHVKAQPCFEVLKSYYDGKAPKDAAQKAFYAMPDADQKRLKTALLEIVALQAGDFFGVPKNRADALNNAHLLISLGTSEDELFAKGIDSDHMRGVESVKNRLQDTLHTLAIEQAMQETRSTMPLKSQHNKKQVSFAETRAGSDVAAAPRVESEQVGFLHFIKEFLVSLKG